MGPLRAHWAILKPAWAVLGSLEAPWMHVGTILAVLVASWRHLGGHLGRLGPGKALTQGFLGLTRGFGVIDRRIFQIFRVAGGTGRRPLGAFITTKNHMTSNTPCSPVINQQGAADRRRLRRVTAAPCLFGNAYVAESWARAWPSYRTMCSPNRFGKPSGNTWRRTGKRRRVRKKESGQAIGPCVPPAVVETLRGTRGGGSGG